MEEENVKIQFRRLLAEHPNDFRIYSKGDEINSENMEMPQGPFENTDSQIIKLIQDALAAKRQIAVVAAGATKILLMLAKQDTKLFDGPPGTKMSPYKALVVDGHTAIIEGTQAKLNGNHEKGKSLYKSALASFQQAEKMRPNEASPKLGIAEASSHLWESEDPKSVIKKIKAAEQLLRQGLSEDKINKFDGKDVIQFQYAMCNLAMENRDIAKDNLRQVLVINPENRLAPKILKTLEEEDSKKGGCFIATATYGSPLAPEVQTLRNFREDVLRKSTVGRSLILIYGILSPSLAKFISRSHFLKKVVRRLLIEPLLRQINP